jgi:hypothetical protein
LVKEEEQQQGMLADLMNVLQMSILRLMAAAALRTMAWMSRRPARHPSLPLI